MPLQISPVPYRGDQYLFQGISGAGQSIGEGIEQMMQRLKQTKAMRTMAVDGLGMDPDAVDKMSAGEVSGHLQAAALKNQQAEAQARRMMETAHANYFNRYNQKADADDRFSSAVSKYMQPPPAMAPGDQGPPQATPQMDPQTLMRLEAQSGTLDPEKAMQYMKELGGAGTDNPMVYDTSSIPNATVVKTKKGNEFQVIRNNDGAAPEAPAGYQMVGDGKGGWKPVKLNTGDLSASDRTKFQAQYEKNIDSLIQSYSFAKGDPEMEGLIKERIQAHRQAINNLQPAAAGGPRKAMGGYKIGTVYAGMKYVGGDPTDAASFEKVK